MKRILAIDAGTEQSGYCIMEYETYKPLLFGKIDNEELLQIVIEGCYDALVYEEFQSYGMPVGKSTIVSITWNGRFIQAAVSMGKPFYPILRVEEKICLCGTTKAKDGNLRAAMIERFASFDFKNGKGTKKEPDWFYGFSKDAWTGAIIAVTWIDKQKEAG